MGGGGRASAGKKAGKRITAGQLNKNFGEKRVLSNADRATIDAAAGRGNTQAAQAAKKLQQSLQYGRRKVPKQASKTPFRPGEKGVGATKKGAATSRRKYAARAKRGEA